MPKTSSHASAWGLIVQGRMNAIKGCNNHSIPDVAEIINKSQTYTRQRVSGQQDYRLSDIAAYGAATGYEPWEITGATFTLKPPIEGGK